MLLVVPVLLAFLASRDFVRPLALEMDYPEPRPVEAEAGEVIAVPEVGGRHHHDERHAA
ncbi:MAG: hypothetical protein O7G88_13120 [bacterium]|nr:hypothetical protein [bacterium]